MHLSSRPARVKWDQRQGWADRSHSAAWYQFVQRATPRQFELFNPRGGSTPSRRHSDRPRYSIEGV